MNQRRQQQAWIFMICVAGCVLTSLFLARALRRRPISLKGAVIRQDADTKKERPISDVEVTVAGELSSGVTRSDSAGFFSVNLKKGIRRGQSISLTFRHPDYRLAEIEAPARDELLVVRMIPLRDEVQGKDAPPPVVVSNVRARYSVNSTTTVNIGSAAKIFQVVNTANLPCKNAPVCSPDGKWKAAVASASLDAGAGNEFKNARASCIAGPCPFSKIDSDDFSHGGRYISVSARNWSDTTTFLLEAEVSHSMVSDNVRESYPVIFGQTLNFTLPASSEGVSIEAELDGTPVVFPLGPNLFLSWADCNARVNKDQTKVYRCELKPGHRF